MQTHVCCPFKIGIYLPAAGIALSLALLLGSPLMAEEPPGTCKEQYDTTSKFLVNPDESVLITGVIGWSRTNNHRLIWDERYAVVARHWSEQLVKGEVDPNRMLPIDRLRFELRTAGVTDAAVLPFSITGPVETWPPEMLRFLNEEADRGRYTHFAVGVGRTKDNQQMISTLLLGRRPAWIEPLPVCPTAGSRLPLRIRLLKDYSHPRWLLGTPRGAVQAETLLYEAGIWQGEVPLDDGRGIYQMELVVQGPTGPEIAALFPMYVGVERSKLPTVKMYPAPPRYQTPEEAEQALLRMINQSRSKQKLPALAAKDDLCKVAREYSMELLVDRHAVHRTSNSGALNDRLRKKDIPFARALENVSLSPSPEMAHERFLESPSHRLNVLDPSVTLVGVGVAMERGAEEDIVAVTEVYLEPSESGEVNTMAGKLHLLINQQRKGRGRFALGLDPDLSRAALHSARRLADLADLANPEREGGALLKDLQSDGLDVADPRIRYFKTSSLQQVLAAPEILDEDINRLGIGIARISNGNAEGQMWVSLIFAGR